VKIAARPLLELRRDETLALGSLVSSVDGTAPALSTEVKLTWQQSRLVVEFEVEETSPWGTYRERDSPIWQEEVVEVFLAPGFDPPTAYYEIELSPLGTVFDAVVWNPQGDRTDFRVDPSWDCPGLETEVELRPENRRWWARISVPWHALLAPGQPTPSYWSGNFYRIARPRPGTGGLTVFAAWSPTGIAPPDFHRPAAFGILRLVD
jgi:hypothetical protein